jgi:hypothetical protein
MLQIDDKAAKLAEHKFEFFRFCVLTQHEIKTSQHDRGKMERPDEANSVTHRAAAHPSLSGPFALNHEPPIVRQQTPFYPKPFGEWKGYYPI